MNLGTRDVVFDLVGKLEKEKAMLARQLEDTEESFLEHNRVMWNNVDVLLALVEEMAYALARYSVPTHPEDGHYINDLLKHAVEVRKLRPSDG